MTRHFAIRLKKSGIGRNEGQKRTLAALGLSRFGKTVYLSDTAAVRGMLFKVVHLVEVTPVEGQVPEDKRGKRSHCAAAAAGA